MSHQEHEYECIKNSDFCPHITSVNRSFQRVTLIKVTYDSNEARGRYELTFEQRFPQNPCMFFHCSINLMTSHNIAAFTSKFAGRHHPLK